MKENYVCYIPLFKTSSKAERPEGTVDWDQQAGAAAPTCVNHHENIKNIIKILKMIIWYRNKKSIDTFLIVYYIVLFTRLVF